MNSIWEREDFGDLPTSEFILHIILEAEECCNGPFILEMEPLEEDD